MKDAVKVLAVLFAILGALMLLAVLLVGTEDSVRSAAKAKTVRSPTPRTVREDSPTYMKLAAIQADSRTPPASLVSGFRAPFGKIESACPDSPKRLGDMLVGGHQEIPGRTTLLQLTKSVANGPLEFGNVWGSCSGVIAAVVVDYKTGHLP